MVTIKAITNSGKEVSIIPWGIQESGNYKITVYIDGLDELHPRSCNDGYIHLIPYNNYSPEEITAIKDINKFYFAKKIEILTDVKEIESHTYITGFKTKKEILSQIFKNIKNVFVKQDLFSSMGWNENNEKIKLQFKPKEMTKKIQIFNYKTVEEIVVLQSLHLGGSFQKFYTNKNWLNESEKISGKKVYLA